MKLALLTSGLFKHTGGPPIVIANLLNQLAKYKDLEIAYYGIKGEIHSEIERVDPKIKKFDFKPFTGYRFSIKYLIGLIKYSPNVVWIHGLWLWPNLAGLLYATFARKKIILTPHGVLTKQMFSNKWYKKITIGFIELILLITNGKVVFHYLSEAERMACILKPFRKKSIIIPNFVNATKVDTITRENQFVFLARIAPIKGIEDLVELNANVDIYGFGDPSYIRRVIPENANFKGEIENSRVSEIFSKYHYYVLPSYGEGLPTSAIEAAFCGCILIVSNECNLNMFTNEEDCIMFTAGKDNLKKALHHANNMSTIQREAIRAKSLETVSKYFGHKNLLISYNKLIYS